ncbi:TauD/TfdA family dioxygenase [Micromonospora chersina]|uniref:TauD/TfdA family dioxygenase n=1 Tax=Micromonospora chersina TaxID=47854 RepID=UPI003713E8D8
MQADAHRGAAPVASWPPAVEGTGVDWIRSEREGIRDVLAESGALIVRGFGLRAPAELEQVALAMGVQVLDEYEGFTSRDKLAARVYSGSVWPTDQPMCHHHELSYLASPPRTMLLGCLAAPRVGGRTGLADAERVLAALPADVVERFERDGWLLRRTYRPTAGLSWQAAFRTDTRAGVESYCAANDIDVSWSPDGVLRTRQRRPAVIRHPLTGRRCWVNQAAFLNEWTLEPAVREYLVYEYGADDLPINTAYGDGTEIAKTTVDAINQAYVDLSSAVKWVSGDLLLLDNLRTAHSREPFDGTRAMAVLLGDPTSLAADMDSSI